MNAHFYIMGSDDDDLTVEQVNQLPTAHLPADATPYNPAIDEEGYYSTLNQYFDIHFGDEVVFFTKKGN